MQKKGTMARQKGNYQNVTQFIFTIYNNGIFMYL